MQAAASAQNIHDLSTDDKKSLMRAEFSGLSRFQREFGADARDFDCAPHAERLRAEIIRLLAEKGVNIPGGDITKLHETLPQELKDYNFNDGVNKISTLLYDTDDRFLAAYHAFIRECVQKIFPYPFYFQATTTIRLHTPGGANANHYPRYHTDIGYGHPPHEINLWIPLTEPKAPQMHGFRRMSVEDSRQVLETFDYDFAPFIERAINDKGFTAELNTLAPQVATPFGQFTAFDSRCIHTGEPLVNHTRASIDIRIMPVDDFQRLNVEYQGTGRRRMRYVPGHGYHSLSSTHI